MINIDIDKLKSIKKQLDDLKDDDVAFLCEDGSEKYAVLPMELYEAVEDIVALSKRDFDELPNVKVVNANSLELSYEEYETVKKQIMDAFDRTFKPKPEKLN